ncbi:MAG: hypothetical protein GXP54_07800 [Deltaproteobacteria bacterium]|nr:hypothetical protein [Deltaproteobacteria bacterium]
MENESGRREMERLPGVFQVHFTVDGNEGDGVIVDLTPNGMRLRTNYPVEEGKTVHVSMVGPDYQTLEMEGQIRWVTELSPVPIQSHSFAFEAGINVADPPTEMSDIFDRHSARFIDFRDWPRYPYQMRIEMVGPGTWEATFALNLSRRGLFVMTRQELNIGQLVQLRATIDEDEDPLELNGQVVYLLSHQHAEEVGAAPGVGIRLGALPPAVKERYGLFIEHLDKKYNG